MAQIIKEKQIGEEFDFWQKGSKTCLLNLMLISSFVYHCDHFTSNYYPTSSFYFQRIEVNL